MENGAPPNAPLDIYIMQLLELKYKPREFIV